MPRPTSMKAGWEEGLKAKQRADGSVRGPSGPGAAGGRRPLTLERDLCSAMPARPVTHKTPRSGLALPPS